MYSAMQRTLLAITGWSTLFGCATGESHQPSAGTMTFFVTSVGS